LQLDKSADKTQIPNYDNTEGKCATFAEQEGKAQGIISQDVLGSSANLASSHRDQFLTLDHGSDSWPDQNGGPVNDHAKKIVRSLRHSVEYSFHKDAPETPADG
jgi:hypothetical protein